MTDLELLRDYAASNSEDAFATVVRKHTGLVYAAALRQTGDAQDAEEITQAVFLILARKAGKLPAATILSGWLLRTTHFVALNARRKQLRRPQTEPVDPDLPATETDAAWRAIVPLLDEALVTLNEGNRNAISLRFFEGRSFKEIAGIMGLSEDAAQKRVSRSLDLLRANFAKRGLAVSATLLVVAIGAHAIQAAPARVVSAVTSAVAPGAVGTGNVSTLIKLAAEAMNAARRRVLLLRGGAIALMVLMGLVGFRWLVPQRVPQPFQLPVTQQANPNGLASQTAPQVRAADMTQNVAQAGGMLLRVVDAETDRPVIDARVTARQVAGYPNSITNTLTTDGNGECRLPVDRTPAENWTFYAEILKDGYALQFAGWSSARGDSLEDIPAQFETKLVRSSTIGGVVLNEKGEPLSGTRVTFGVSGQTFPPDMQRQREGLVTGYDYHAEFTDALGRWRCEHAPPQFDTLLLRVAHPDGLPATFGVSRSGATTNAATVCLPEEDFRQQTATMVLKSGLVVYGLVTDEQGNPVAGAKVIENRHWRDAWAAHWTGTDGRFRLADLATSELVVTVEVNGFVATDKTIQLETQNDELKFVMKPAAILRGRVVDEAGVPLRAVVSAAGGEFETVTPNASVWTAADIKPARFEWSTTTDADGRFEWRSAPPEHKRYAVYASGYESPKQLELAADGTEHLVTLHRSSPPPALRISGTVTDAQSGVPVRDFQVWMERRLPARGPGGNTVLLRVASTLQTTGKDGRFAFPLREPAAGFTLQIRAEGYVSAQRDITGMPTNNCVLNFQLARDEPVAGVVLTPDGQPASGAVVAACSGFTRAYMNVPGQINLAHSSALHTVTDADGRFLLPSASAAKLILVTHAAGYADSTPRESGGSLLITLQAWGRIEGMLRIGRRPGEGETILLGSPPPLPPGSPGLGLNVKVTADSDGRFVVDHVPPGKWVLSHLLKIGDGTDGMMPQTQVIPIEVRAGQTTQVTLGGTGWRVVGKIRSDGITAPINWQKCIRDLIPRRSAGAQRDGRRYTLVFDSDGGFAIDDVPPGAYELNILAPAASSSGSMLGNNFLGGLSQEIILPEMPPGAEPQTFDAGVLDLHPTGATQKLR